MLNRNRRMFRTNRFNLYLLVALVLGLTACSDQPEGSPAPGTQTGQLTENSSGPVTKLVPSIPPPTPTYSPLPVTPTPQPTATPPVVSGGKIGGAVLNDGLTLHPYKRNNPTGLAYQELLYAARLTRLDPITLLPVAGAAESWTVSDTTVTFVLRDDLKWSDGKPLTSADYVWTYQQARKPENGWPLAQAAFYNPADPASTGIETYEAPDPRTLKIKLHTASSDLLRRADVIEPLPRQVWQGLDWNDPAKNPQINAPTVVSGPWKLTEWKRNYSISFERNPASTVWPVPRLEALSFQVLPDSQVALQKLKSGELDFFTPSNTDFVGFSRLPNLQAYIWRSARPAWYFAGFNFRKPDWQDKTLRQALAWTVDYRAILGGPGAGLGRQLNSSLPPWQPGFNPFTARYELNLDKARELLKQGGYSLKDGKLTNKSGKPLSALKLVYNSTSPLYEGIASTLKANFGTLGLAVETRNLSFEDYKKFLASPGADFDLFLSGWTTDYAPENFGDVWRGGPEVNSGNYENPRLLDMYAKAVAETDPTRRKDWLAQTQAIEAEELPYLFLYAEQQVLVANKRLAGFSTGLLGPEKNLYTDWFAVK